MTSWLSPLMKNKLLKKKLAPQGSKIFPLKEVLMKWETTCLCKNYFLWECFHLPKMLVSSGYYEFWPSCSKLITSLINVSLKFQKLITQICQYFW